MGHILTQKSSRDECLDTPIIYFNTKRCPGDHLCSLIREGSVGPAIKIYQKPQTKPPPPPKKPKPQPKNISKNNKKKNPNHKILQIKTTTDQKNLKRTIKGNKEADFSFTLALGISLVPAGEGKGESLWTSRGQTSFYPYLALPRAGCAGATLAGGCTLVPSWPALNNGLCFQRCSLPRLHRQSSCPCLH